jgi:HEPN domain-containing protein
MNGKIREKYREIVGFTFDKERSNETFWYNRAVSFHEGASILCRHEAHILVFLFNAALSIELLFKAITIANKSDIRFKHNLLDLAEDAEISFSDNQKKTLEFMSEILIWKGRYPTPTKAGIWNNFQDNVFEKHIIRERYGNVGVTRANPETFPSPNNYENYEVLWNIANQKWSEIQMNKQKIAANISERHEENS